jgi:uncharacterized protein
MVVAGSFLLALGAGWVARRLNVPGGAIVGALIATAAVSLLVGDLVIGDAVRFLIFTGVGTMIGGRVDRPSLRALPSTAFPSLLAAVLIIMAGIGIAYLLRGLGMGFDGDMLATSPGALSVLAAAALENDLDAVTVSLYHVLRIVLILLTLPLLLVLLPDAVRRSAKALRTRQPTSGPAGRWSPPAGTDLGLLALTALGAAAGGALALASGLQGALIVGTVLGGAAVTMSYRRPVYRPSGLMFGVQAGLGWIIGTLVTDETLLALRDATVPAVLSSVLIVVAGIVIAWLLRVLGIAPEGDVLATSPGALEALASLADERNIGPLEVAVFHTVRLLLVIFSLPLLLRLVPG